MAHQIKGALARSSDTIIADAIGMASLVVMFFGALYLPSLF